LLTTADHPYLGLLDIEAGRVLNELREKWSVQYRSFVLTNTGAKSTLTTQSDADPQIHIVVYGQSYEANVVGEFLSRNRLFLQHPFLHDETIPYSNPHYFLAPGQQLRIPQRYGPRITQGTHSISKMVDQVLHIFEDSVVPGEYSEAHVSSKLLTPLKE
jgi:hypothetical protein